MVAATWELVALGWKGESVAAGPLPPTEALASFRVAEGFQVELFAAEPLLMNPTSIDVDHRGRVWVAEAVNYRRYLHNQPLLRKEGDRIVVLLDTDGDGRADRATTFYQGPEIIAPLSVCVIPQADGKALRVLVAQSPDILEFWDRDGDLKADGPPVRFLSGFGGFDHDHGVHGLHLGPDGRLYFTVGDSGVGSGRDRQGRPIPPLQARDGRGRRWVSNSTDCRAGTVWRCNLDGTHLELIAHNFRNNYEAGVDSFGEIWLSDNDDDGNQQTRICLVLPGGNYGYHPRGPGQSHWHEEQPGIVHKVLRTGFGSPTGICFYEGTLFGSRYLGALLHCDAGPREVRAFFRKPKGAGYELDKQILLTSTDNWFRPSDVCVAPDGSIFVADWYDRGVGGHGMGDPFDGRIYRLTPKGHKGYTIPEVALSTGDGLRAALASPNLATRQLAINVLQAMPQADRDRWLKDALTTVEQPHLAARLLWQSKLHGTYLPPVPLPEQKPRLVNPALERFEQNPQFRAMLARWYQGHTPQEIETFLNGYIPRWIQRTPPDLACGREAAVLLQYLPAEQARPHFYTLARLHDGQDHFYRAALNIACGIDPTRRDLLLADFGQHFPQWNDSVADLVWELRPKSMWPRLGQLLEDPKLSIANKVRVLDIVAVGDDRTAGRTLVGILTSNVALELKRRALDHLRLHGPGRWQDVLTGPEGTAAIDTLLAEERSRLLGVQLLAIARPSDGVTRLAALLHDPATAREVRQEAIRALGHFQRVTAVEQLQAAFVSLQDEQLRAEIIRALGRQTNGPAKDEAAGRALQALQKLVRNTSVTMELRRLALEALAGTRPGTIWLLDTHQKGELPQELVAPAGRLLRNSPFQAERNRALLLFPAPGKLDPKKLPAISELARRHGDPARGKQVWEASLNGAAQCARCHAIRGIGGQVGPDLSMIGKKASRENLYESILFPSKAIADQYVAHQVTTTSEVTITGLLVADTPEAITLRDANGKDITIPRKEIDGEVRKLKVSLMPEDLVAALTEDELVDLVAYLETLRTPALTPPAAYVAGPYSARSMQAALDTPFAPEKSPIVIPDKPAASPWRILRADARGYYDLAALHGPAAARSASYLYWEIDSPREQSATILLGTDDGATLWLNGTQVFTSRVTRAAAPEQERLEVTLRKGKNALLLKVANGDGPHGAFLTLLAEDELRLLLP
ncbi:MAG: HEAT repeat domain-containing protein [Gemmataceae bacterium]|nr:HEAT repeat domain-containing protein [Gemmataceae bacterium]MDW8242010.1 HEAT repeat domain-containing protein [Thermogemmata sp.]